MIADIHGVKTVSPPEKLIPDLQHSINSALALLQGDEQGALVGVVTVDAAGRKTAHAAVVAKLGGHWTIAGWVGTTGAAWGQSVEGGGAVKLTW